MRSVPLLVLAGAAAIHAAPDETPPPTLTPAQIQRGCMYPDQIGFIPECDLDPGFHCHIIAESGIWSKFPCHCWHEESGWEFGSLLNCPPPYRPPGPPTLPTPEPTATPSPVPTESPSPAPTDSPSPVPTDSPTPNPTDTPSPVPTETPTPGPTDTPSPVPTDTPSPVPTETPAPGPTDTPSPVPTDSPSPVPTTSPSPPTPTPTNQPNKDVTQTHDDKKDKTALKVGLGVGLGVGLPTTAALAWIANAIRLAVANPALGSVVSEALGSNLAQAGLAEGSVVSSAVSEALPQIGLSNLPEWATRSSLSDVSYASGSDLRIDVKEYDDKFGNWVNDVRDETLGPRQMERAQDDVSRDVQQLKSELKQLGYPEEELDAHLDELGDEMATGHANKMDIFRNWGQRMAENALQRFREPSSSEGSSGEGSSGEGPSGEGPSGEGPSGGGDSVDKGKGKEPEQSNGKQPDPPSDVGIHESHALDMSEDMDHYRKELKEQGLGDSEIEEIIRDEMGEDDWGEGPSWSGADYNVAGGSSSAMDSPGAQEAADVASSGAGPNEVADALIQAGVPARQIASTMDAITSAINSLPREDSSDAGSNDAARNAALEVISNAVTRHGLAVSDAASAAYAGPGDLPPESFADALRHAGVPVRALKNTMRAVKQAITEAKASGGSEMRARRVAFVTITDALPVAAGRTSPGDLCASKEALTRAALNMVGSSYNFWNMYPVVIYNIFKKIEEKTHLKALQEIIADYPPPEKEPFMGLPFPFHRKDTVLPGYDCKGHDNVTPDTPWPTENLWCADLTYDDRNVLSDGLSKFPDEDWAPYYLKHLRTSRDTLNMLLDAVPIAMCRMQIDPESVTMLAPETMGPADVSKTLRSLLYEAFKIQQDLDKAASSTSPSQPAPQTPSPTSGPEVPEHPEFPHPGTPPQPPPWPPFPEMTASLPPPPKSTTPPPPPAPTGPTRPDTAYCAQLSDQGWEDAQILYVDERMYQFVDVNKAGVAPYARDNPRDFKDLQTFYIAVMRCAMKLKLSSPKTLGLERDRALHISRLFETLENEMASVHPAGGSDSGDLSLQEVAARDLHWDKLFIRFPDQKQPYGPLCRDAIAQAKGDKGWPIPIDYQAHWDRLYILGPEAHQMDRWVDTPRFFEQHKEPSLSYFRIHPDELHKILDFLGDAECKLNALMDIYKGGPDPCCKAEYGHPSARDTVNHIQAMLKALRDIQKD